MSDTLYIKPDKEKTYSVNSEEELSYYKSLRPIRLWSRTHFKCKCSKCHEDKDILLYKYSSYLRYDYVFQVQVLTFLA